MNEKMRALLIAAKASDAFSADAWGPVLWVSAAQMLCDMELTDAEVEGVLRSKMTRWARDAYGEPSTYLGELYKLVAAVKINGKLREYI